MPTFTSPNYSSRVVCFFSSPALQSWVPESETRPARFQRAFQRTGFSQLSTGG